MLRRIFIDPGGIRPLWRLLMYMVMSVVIALLLLFVVQPWPTGRAEELWDLMAIEAILVAAAIVPALIMAKIEKRPFGLYGLPFRNAFGKLFWVGAVWGLGAISALLGAIHGLDGFSFGHLALHGMRILEFALFWGAYFLLVGFFEEFLIRGYTQFTLTSAIGFWPAAALLSAIFGGLHLRNPGEAWVGGVSAGLIGFFFCFTLRRTGNLWFAVGFHFSFDWGETFLYSVPNSGMQSSGHLLSSYLHGPRWLTGGTIGPEGSVFVFLLIAVVWLVFARVYPQPKSAT